VYDYTLRVFKKNKIKQGKQEKTMVLLRLKDAESVTSQ